MCIRDSHESLCLARRSKSSNELHLDVLQEFRDCKKEVTFPTDFDAAERLSFFQQLFHRIFENKAGTLPERSDLDDNTLHEEFNWHRALYMRPYWRCV